jgi:hypothetical protein
MTKLQEILMGLTRPEMKSLAKGCGVNLSTIYRWRQGVIPRGQAPAFLIERFADQGLDYNGIYSVTESHQS